MTGFAASTLPFLHVSSQPLPLPSQHRSSQILSPCWHSRRPNDNQSSTEMPMSPPTAHFLLLPLFLLAANTAAARRTPWPEQFHAVLLTNLTASGGRLEMIDVYYDWPRGRSLNVLRRQLAGETVYNVEWVNGSSYLFDRSSCTVTWHPVGILPPDWIDSAAYLGRETVDGFDCHVWSHRFFARYYQEVATGRPVFWDFVGSLRHVLSFKVGGVPRKNSPKWQAPAYCFNADGKVVNSSTARFAGAAASFDQ